jgi:hypothetical protein
VKSSLKIKIFGIITILIGGLTIMVFIPSVISMAERLNSPGSSVVFYIRFIFLWGFLFMLAGFSTLGKPVISLIMYSCALIFTLLLCILRFFPDFFLYFHILISAVGIIISFFAYRQK